MQGTAIIWPMLAHVALVYAVYVLMFLRRKAMVQQGRVKISDYRENRTEPPESLFVKNNLSNQFELPVLFHICCLALLVTGGVGAVMIVEPESMIVSKLSATLDPPTLADAPPICQKPLLSDATLWYSTEPEYRSSLVPPM